MTAAAAVFSAAGWLALAALRGRFWSVSPTFEEAVPRAAAPSDLAGWPPVVAVVPARNEADVLPDTLPSLLAQDYPGRFAVVLVDDDSDDGTAQVAHRLAARAGAPDRLRVVRGTPRPDGWAGKVWAMRQGLEVARAAEPAYLLLTDADIAHPPDALRRLVSLAESERLALASVMVALRCRDRWERLLIPAFVYFFRQLYPFRWVADPRRPTAAAAGGCMLVRSDALAAAGDFAPMRDALIDDVTLGGLVKSAGGRLWLGHAASLRSVRAYPGLGDVWDMVARTAFTQLRYSVPLLGATVAGLVLSYAVPPWAVVAGAVDAARGHRRRGAVTAAAGAVGYATMSLTYLPTVRHYRLPSRWALTLPAAAACYLGMTVDSARRYAGGRGGGWKGRVAARA